MIEPTPSHIKYLLPYYHCLEWIGLLDSGEVASFQLATVSVSGSKLETVGLERVAGIPTNRAVAPQLPHLALLHKMDHLPVITDRNRVDFVSGRPFSIKFQIDVLLNGFPS